MGEDSYTPSKRPELFENAEEDPYADVKLSELPLWWRDNVETFNEHGLRPYRPPRFLDGEQTVEITRELENELEIDLRLRAVNPQETDSWQIWADDQAIARKGHHRDGDGYSVYEISAEEFRELVRDAVVE